MRFIIGGYVFRCQLNSGREAAEHFFVVVGVLWLCGGGRRGGKRVMEVLGCQ